MSRQQILERERRWARPAAVSAMLAAPLLIASVVGLGQLDLPSGDVATAQLRAFDANESEVLLVSLARGMSFLCLIAPLVYLFRAAQARSDRVLVPMIGFAFIGPGLFAAQVVVGWFGQAQVADDFLASAARGGDIYSFLDDVVDDSTLSAIAANLTIPALLGIGIAMLYTALQAMRAGLLTRFFATLGMALAGATIFLPGLELVLVDMFWFFYLGLVVIDRAPGNPRPAAWAAGEAIPWPKPGEEADREQTVDPEVVEGDAAEVLDPTEPRDHSARRERARKRKRKQRRR